MTTLQLSRVTKSFNGRNVVDGIDLNVEAGEIIALLGSSGCGKTTTLRTIVGLEHPTSGTIRIGDSVVFSSEIGVVVAPEKRRVGMVFQSYAIWPHMSVEANVSYGLKLQGIATEEIKRRVTETLTLVGLTKHRTRFPGTLSGGEQQRVALARSLVTRPALLLMDEPLSNLDLKLREHMRQELRRIIKAAGLTAIYVTHDQSDAMALADRIALMTAGRICEVGTPHEIYHRPRTMFGSEFLGSANLVQVSAMTFSAGIGTARLTSGLEVAFALPAERPAAVEWLMIRPERVRILDSPAAGPNVFAGVVSEVTFLGNITMLRVDCGVLALLVQTVGSEHRIGESVSVHLDPAWLLPVVPDGTGSGETLSESAKSSAIQPARISAPVQGGLNEQRAVT